MARRSGARPTRRCRGSASRSARSPFATRPQVRRRPRAPERSARSAATAISSCPWAAPRAAAVPQGKNEELPGCRAPGGLASATVATRECPARQSDSGLPPARRGPPPLARTALQPRTEQKLRGPRRRRHDPAARRSWMVGRMDPRRLRWCNGGRGWWRRFRTAHLLHPGWDVHAALHDGTRWPQLSQRCRSDLHRRRGRGDHGSGNDRRSWRLRSHRWRSWVHERRRLVHLPVHDALHDDERERRQVRDVHRIHLRRRLGHRRADDKLDRPSRQCAVELQLRHLGDEPLARALRWRRRGARSHRSVTPGVG